MWVDNSYTRRGASQWNVYTAGVIEGEKEGEGEYKKKTGGVGLQGRGGALPLPTLLKGAPLTCAKGQGSACFRFPSDTSRLWGPKGVGTVLPHFQVMSEFFEISQKPVSPLFDWLSRSGRTEFG